MSVIVGIDLGSRRCGCVAATEALPLHVHMADVVHVPPPPRGHRLDVQPAVDAIVARVLASRAARVVIEHAMFYAPSGMSPQEAARRAQAHEVCSHIEAGLYRALTDAPGSAEEIATWAGVLPPSPIELVTVTRASWVHRVVPHTSGGITDAMANEGLQTHVAAESWERWLCGGGDDQQDRRDAAGAVVGYLLPAPRKARKQRAARGRARERSAEPPAAPITAEQRIEHKRAVTRARVQRHRGTLSLEELTARGCLCYVDRPKRKGRHKVGCPMAPAPKWGDTTS